MIYDWYNIINKADFEALDIPSREVEVILEGVGLSTIMVVKGIEVGIIYDDVHLSLGLATDNLFAFGGYAVYLHPTTGDIYLGIEAA